MSISKTQLINGHFQDAKGNALAGGSLKFRLTQDAVTNDHTAQILGGIELTFALDANGDIFGTQVADTPKSMIWGNDDLLPSTTSYIVTAFAANGQPAWANPQVMQVISGSTFDLNTWTPSTIQIPNSSSGVTLLHNGSLNSSQGTLNLVDGTNTTVVDNGAGALQLNVSAAVTPTSIAGGGTGGTSEALMQETLNGAVTVRRLTLADVNVGSGSLTAAAVLQSSPATINLSTQGTYDWMYVEWTGASLSGDMLEANGALRLHWKRLNGRLLDACRFALPTQVAISSVSGSNFTFNGTSGDDCSFNETTANAVLSSRQGGFWFNNNSNTNFAPFGFVWRDTPLSSMNAKTVKFYVFVNNCTATLTARVSDGSSSDATATMVNGSSGEYVVTVNVTPGSFGATLSVSFEVSSFNNSASGVGIEAVTMA